MSLIDPSSLTDSPSLMDSHCHLEMLDDPGRAVAEASSAGVGTVVTLTVPQKNRRLRLLPSGAK